MGFLIGPLPLAGGAQTVEPVGGVAVADPAAVKPWFLGSNVRGLSLGAGSRAGFVPPRQLSATFLSRLDHQLEETFGQTTQVPLPLLHANLPPACSRLIRETALKHVLCYCITPI